MASIYRDGTWTPIGPAPTGISQVNALIIGTKWGDHGLGTGAGLTFSFPSDFSFAGAGSGSFFYAGPPTEGAAALSDPQQQGARTALQKWANVANLSFVEVTDKPDSKISPLLDNSSVGDIRFGQSTLPETAEASPPGVVGPAGGDVWISRDDAQYDNPALGNYAFDTLMHEVGHALGLEHPHEGLDLDTMDMAYDAKKYTIMSYRDYVGEASIDGYAADYDYPSTPMLYDVLAIQMLYGANMSYRAGNDVYSWAADAKIFECIWDAGGNDTLSAQGQSSAVELHLTSGIFSSIGKLMWDGRANIRDNLVIAFDAWIENAVGSAFNDVLYGNRIGNELSGGDGADAIYGAEREDRLDDGNDIIDGGAGDDWIEGFAGNDTLMGGAGRDTISGGEGHDLLYGGVGYDWLRGDAGDDRLEGGDGGDTLDGGTGRDVMVGGDGGDLYAVDDMADKVIETGGLAAGVDAVMAWITYTLPDSVEHLYLLGSAAIDGTGNDRDNELFGNSASNQLWGLAGADTLDGMGGIDTLIGGAGSDLYIVDSIDDRVVEYWADEGVDTVYASDTFWLGAGIENLVLTGAAVRGYGNEGDNRLTGNDADNVLSANWLDDKSDGNDTLVGLGGNDQLVGGDGNDVLLGGAGDDMLDGGAGSDVMDGGAGNDGYVVRQVGDSVIETLPGSQGGIDTVSSFISHYALGAQIENLKLSGQGSGIGNALDNLIEAGNGDSWIDGGLGHDTVSYASSGAAVRVSLAIATAQATGGSATDTLLGIESLGGSRFNDWLTGDTQPNTLNGAQGSDTLQGGGGADTYVLDNRIGADTILGFERGIDRIAIVQAALRIGDGDGSIERATTVLGPGGFLPSAELVIISHNLPAGPFTAANAAMAIGAADAAYGRDSQALFAVNNGVDTALYLFSSSSPDRIVSSSELTLLVTLPGVVGIAPTDLVFLV